MTDIKDKIIADLRHELDTARAVIKVMEDNERLAEERHEHELREASGSLGKLRERVQNAAGTDGVTVGEWRSFVRVMEWIDEVLHA